MQLKKATTMSPMPLRVQSGFSLLEVLVTLVILSLGILGLAGLQSASLKNGHSALLRAQAAQYAHDMADRMRVNRTAAIAGHYNRLLTDPAPTGSTLANADLKGWLRQVGSLPEGRAAISVNSAGVTTITVRWDETALGNTNTDDNCPVPREPGRVCFVLEARL